MAYRGHNTAHGFDVGPPPPNSGFSAPQFPGMPGYIQPPPAVYQPPMPYMSMPGAFPFQHPNPHTTHPSSAPLTDHGFPGVHLKNHLGGVGVPPGYAYIFPPEHTIIHILRTCSKPWQAGLTIHPIDPSTHTKFYVPASMNVKEFLKQAGCTDGDEKKNVVYEVVEKGNGLWAQGLRINMDDKDKMKKTLGDFGWNMKRNGNIRAGGRPVVWLWREKGE